MAKKKNNIFEKIVLYFADWFEQIKEVLYSLIIMTIFILVILRYGYPFFSGGLGMTLVIIIFIIIIFSWSCWLWKGIFKLKEEKEC